MQQWVQTVGSLITQNPEAQIQDCLLAECNKFVVDGEEVRITTVTSNPPQVPQVVGFSKESTNSGRLVEGLGWVRFAFVIRPEQDVDPGRYPGVYIQTLRVVKVDGQTVAFERVGKEEWFLPNSSPRN